MPDSNEILNIFDKKELRVRRDTSKLPDLIETITIFYQNSYNRFKEFVSGKYLFTDFEDLAYGLRFSLQHFVDISQNIDENARLIMDIMESTKILKVKKKKENDWQTKIVEDNKNEFEEKEVERWYTITEVHKLVVKDTSMHRNTVKNKLFRLHVNGFLDIKEPGEGQRAYLFRKIHDYTNVEFSIENHKESIMNIIEEQWNEVAHKTTETINKEIKEVDKFSEFY